MSYLKQLRRISADGCLVHSLSCCNGKVYALVTEYTYSGSVIEIGIEIKDGDVVIKLMRFADYPYPFDYRCHQSMYFLRGSNTELFCIVIGFNFEVETDTTFSLVSLHKLDMTTINWGELKNMFNSSEIWEQMEDLKDSNFFVDLGRDNSVAFTPAIASEFGGNIHIRSKMGKVIYSYNVSDRTIPLSSMFPSQVLPTSHVSVWECRLADDYAKANDDDVALKRLQNYSLLSPWLMTANKKRGIVTFEDPLYGNKYFLKKLPAAIDDGNIFYSGYGWLLYHTMCGLGFCKWEFCNPFTNEVHHLPGTNAHIYSLCFSAPPTSPDCMVVGFGTEAIYMYFVNGEQTWYMVSLDKDNDDNDHDDDDDGPTFYFPTFNGLDLYALCDKGKLHVFKILGQVDYSWKQDVVEAPRSCRYPGEYFLTKCDQHVLLVFVDHFGESIEVFKLNHFTDEWEKTDSLGRHTIYISDSACLCTEAKTPEMEDKIFFARLYNKNGKVVFYSLETGMYHTFSNAKNIDESFEDFVGTKYPLDAHAWIEPTWC